MKHARLEIIRNRSGSELNSCRRLVFSFFQEAKGRACGPTVVFQWDYASGRSWRYNYVSKFNVAADAITSECCTRVRLEMFVKS